MPQEVERVAAYAQACRGFTLVERKHVRQSGDLGCLHGASCGQQHPRCSLRNSRWARSSRAASIPETGHIYTRRTSSARPTANDRLRTVDVAHEMQHGIIVLPRHRKLCGSSRLALLRQVTRCQLRLCWQCKGSCSMYLVYHRLLEADVRRL